MGRSGRSAPSHWLHRYLRRSGLSVSLLPATAAFAFAFLAVSFLAFPALLFRFLTALFLLVRIFWHVNPSFS